MTVASRNRDPPARKDVTCTGMRTARDCGKKRASCSAQSCPLAVRIDPLKRLTSPPPPLPVLYALLGGETLPAAKETNFQRQRSTPCAKESKTWMSLKL